MSATVEIPEVNVSVSTTPVSVNVTQPAIDIVVEQGLGPQGPVGTVESNTGMEVNGNLNVLGKLASIIDGGSF